MKVKETLTLTDKNNLFMQNEIVGLFTGLLISDDEFYDLAYPMCLGYYTVRSANKTISPIYEEILEYTKENTSAGADYISLANRLLAQNIIRPKFIDKWSRIYRLLVSGDYDALKDYEYTEQKDGNNSDTTEYGTTVQDDGSTSSKETTTTNRTNNEDVYGFNSRTPVGDNVNTEVATEIVAGDAEDNTTHNTQRKTGVDTKTFVIDEGITKSGRNAAGAELVEAELNLRNTQIFLDIVYKDIDSVATLPIYI